MARRNGWCQWLVFIKILCDGQMATQVDLLVWNIQNFGQLKSGLKDSKCNLTQAIAQVISASEPDIFCLVELNTTSESRAYKICDALMEALAAEKSAFDICLLSPNTGKEFYAFFVRDTTFVVPLEMSGPAVGGSVSMEIGGPGGVAITAAEFSPAPTPMNGIVLNAFPLIYPDKPAASPTTWPGTRGSALGMFYVPGADPGNELLPIMLVHLAAKRSAALKQLETIEDFSLFYSLRPHGAGGLSMMVQLPGQPAPVATQIYQAVIAGDFNLDAKKNAGDYDWVTTAGASGGLGAQLLFDEPTHLMTFPRFARSTRRDRRDLAINAYDNVILQTSPAAPAPAQGQNQQVDNILNRVRKRQFQYGNAVDYYDKLDRRGFASFWDKKRKRVFTSKEYRVFTKNFAVQLGRGDQSTFVTPEAGLVGARLISDHEPIFVELHL
ncbi:MULTISPECIES: hypothetical protein [Mesorhizobium]|uniref:Endonuclease/exonuclease/phosphatase family metal-dependent hydrolase n=1 Tax=Mesorhizobium shonense TaxID=1209948 RepID=A0ABV2I034_9HYPH|nr:MULTISPECIES: hypothetical protein [unclassified Mesorhizobium]AZO28570.1 hypothetical protein EJ071_14995 [Mesorhizobium sp. M1B.F.Ca.ET.045.04.1.1]RWA69315.1 MAG: hypothetical protein EOQ29_17200 [Mesorhizobium sp.]RWA84412.1 MAG: hypothetical protein EOQ30_08790 [Mesorhizobium sp.]RWB20841.1 MAG: hypothetical protein EOQ40_13045 [Mesorhizobium sp.]RWE01536.1 MAG: hypothetical protein EOS40_10800 [Mesorhizobium sp.]